MNHRQQFVKTLIFEKTDKIPLMPGYGRESTLKRWHNDGLSKDITNANAANVYAYKLAGGKYEMPKGGPVFWAKESMIPEFEKKVIQKKATSQIVQDWKGNICEIGNEYTVDYLGGENGKCDFVTRRWIKCPVENWQDWEGMKKRYNPNDPSRLPETPKELGESLKNRDYPISIHFSGPYWQLREWMGFEQLSVAFYDNPALVKDMIDFWQEYVLQLLKNVLTYMTPDMVHISEDMAYKGFSMLSPKMCREYLMPCWQKWGEIVRNAGVPIYAIDSDGFIGELIPLWIESGLNVCDPIEVAAGNDINQFHKQFGKNMAYRGGVDKRCMAAGGKEIEDEIARIRPVIKDGGFIPSCDHGVPHDVSWKDYVYYVGLLAKETGWL